MAPFNPEIQRTNDPTFGSNSRAVDTPDGIRPQGVQQNQIMPEGQKIGDRSAEYEGQARAFESQGEAASNKGFGDLFSGIVGIADYLGKGGVQLVKKDIENKVYEIASAERAAYTAELEKIKAGVGVGNILGGAPTASNASGDPIPEAVSELGQTLAVLKSARDGGKITKTDYWGRLAAEAQNLRAQYPGFKAEIDAEFSKVTGQNPANARVNGLITEINRAVATQGSQQNRTLRFLDQNNNTPKYEELRAGYLNGTVSEATIYNEVGKYVRKMEDFKVRDLERKERTGTAEERQTAASRDVDDRMGTYVSASVDRFATKYGFNTPDGASQLQKAQDGGQISAQQWRARGDELLAEITRIRVDAMQRARQAGFAKDLKGGQKELAEKIEDSLQPMKAMHDAVMSQNIGLLYSAKREATAILDQNKVDLLKSDKIGPVTATMKTLSDLGMEQYAQGWITNQILGPKGISEGLTDFTNNWGGAFRAQNGKQGVVTYNDFAAEIVAKKITDPIQQKRIMQQRVDDVLEIADSKTPDPVKANIARAAFSPGNNGFLSKLNMDSFDERGRPIHGMNAVFQKWTSPEISREMERLGRSDPALWKQYTDWVKTTWSTELAPRDIAELSKYQKDPNIRISWNAEQKRFNVERTAVPELQAKYREGLGGEGKNTSETLANQQQFQVVDRSLRRINDALQNLRHVAAMENPKDPTAVDAFLLRTIAQATSPDVIRNLNSLPGDLVSKILLGSQKKNANSK